MFFPEFLYQLSGRDQQVTWLDPVLQRLDASGAAVNLTVSYQVPVDRVLLLSALALEVGPGLAQNYTGAIARILGPGASTDSRLAGTLTPGAANQNAFIPWQGEVIVPPNWFVGANVDYNAAVAVNTMRLSIFGILVPVGNIQRL